MIRKTVVRLCAVKFSVPKAPTFSSVAEPGDSPKWELPLDRELSHATYEKLVKVLDPYIETGYTITNQESVPICLASQEQSFGKLKSFCDKSQVHKAVIFLDSILAEGVTVQSNMLNDILEACEANSAYTLVHNIYSTIIKQPNIKPNRDAIRCMIRMYVKMKDFNGAYHLINGLQRWNLTPNAKMFHAIMSEYFEQKNFNEGLIVLEKMNASNVKPNDRTFSNIIRYCNSEDDIIKYHNKMHESGVKPTTHVFMALVKAYTTCGLVEKAQQVVDNCENRSPDCVDEVTNVFVSTLVSDGQIANALHVYHKSRPMRFVNIFHDHLHSEGEISRLLQLLKQLEGTDLWVHGCAGILLYCVQHKLLGSAIDILKQLVKRWHTDEKAEMAEEVVCDEVFRGILGTQPIDVQFGLDLLQAIKQHIGIQPSRKCLDLLLAACFSTRDLERSFLVWKEYQKFGIPYTRTCAIRMYMTLLVSRADEPAKSLLECIPKDDLDVINLLKEWENTFCQQQRRGFIKPTGS